MKLFSGSRFKKWILPVLLLAALCSCNVPDPVPTATMTPDWTATPVPPTATPLPTNTPTATPLPAWLDVRPDDLADTEIIIRYSLDGKVRDTLEELITRFNEENQQGITLKAERAYSMDELSKITAADSTYSSSESLDERYLNYLIENDIKNVIIIGNLPETIKLQLKENGISFEELSGQNSLEVSRNVNNKLISEGYISNPKTAYYGFYGELPTIIPSVVKNNALLIEDSSNTGDILQYLKENNITTVVLTRNAESDYIQMEETDYISSEVIGTLEKNNITVKYLTRKRTLDEATGLYDMKMLTAENMDTKKEDSLNDSTGTKIKTQPPLIEMLNFTEAEDSNNISAKIRNTTEGYEVKWDTIHPYIWKKINDSEYYATSNTGYEYYWIKENSTWNVKYLLDNEEYYNITWLENSDNSWTEIQAENNFTWIYDGMKWKCYNQDNELIYYITNYNSKNV